MIVGRVRRPVVHADPFAAAGRKERDLAELVAACVGWAGELVFSAVMGLVPRDTLVQILIRLGRPWVVEVGNPAAAAQV